ncbi:MAG: hypothetical protein U0841_23400 [Chloroflexia bacterium]
MATLQSWGIETAADVEAWAIKAISGFGQTYTNRLLDWRQTIEGVSFNAARSINLPTSRR